MPIGRKIISYLRVSTKRQGASGLGLEGQRAAVAAHCTTYNGKLVAEYVEVETGKRKDRPALAKALAHAKAAKAVLVVAKLDRLARNVAFTSALMESGVEFVACDQPHANKLTVHILAAIAEHEAQAISDRTKAALNAAKARGAKLGSARPGHWEGREDRRALGQKRAVKAAAVARQAATIEVYAYILPEIQRLRAEGQSLAAVASALNAEGHTTSTGRPWTATAVLRVERRA